MRSIPLEMKKMRVFTSVFMLERVHATFEERMEPLNDNLVVCMSKGANVPGRQAVELHVNKETRPDQSGGKG